PGWHSRLAWFTPFGQASLPAVVLILARSPCGRSTMSEIRSFWNAGGGYRVGASPFEQLAALVGRDRLAAFDEAEDAGAEPHVADQHCANQPVVQEKQALVVAAARVEPLQRLQVWVQLRGEPDHPDVRIEQGAGVHWDVFVDRLLAEHV